MINYHKYTNGESFTLDGEDYVGYVNIKDGKPHSGRVYSTTSDILSTKNTFMGEGISNLYEFDSNYPKYKNIKEYYFKNYDILNKDMLYKTLGNLDTNNLKAFSNYILTRSTIFDNDDCNLKFYTLTLDDDLNSEYMLSYKEPAMSEEFKDSKHFNMLEHVMAENFLVDETEYFKYFCSTIYGFYVFDGSFISPDEVVTYDANTWALSTVWGDAAINISQYYDKTVSYVEGTGPIPDKFEKFQTIETYDSTNFNIVREIILKDNSELITIDDQYINVYDISNYDFCGYTGGVLPVLSNKIKLPNTPTPIKWNNFKEKWSKTELILNRSQKHIPTNDTKFIKFGKTYRTQLSSGGILLYPKYNNTNPIRITAESLECDPVSWSDVNNNLWNSNNIIYNPLKNLNNIVALDIRDTDDYITILRKYSNDFYVSFIHPDDVTNIVTTKIENFDSSGGYKIKFVEEDSNLVSISNKTQHQYRYISNIKYPCGEMDKLDYMIVENLKWGEAYEKYDALKMPWGYSSINGNSADDFTTTVNYKNDNMYAIVRNSAKIYTMYQPIHKRRDNLINENTPRSYDEVSLGSSSMGLLFNSAVAKIIKDIFTIYRNVKAVPKFTENGVDREAPKNIDIYADNFKINGNENINIIPLQRIVKSVLDLQKKINTVI